MEENKEKIVKSKKRKRFFGSVILWLVLFFVFILAFLGAVLYIPAVQNFTVDYLSKKLSAKIEGEVIVGEVKLDVFKGLLAENVRIVENTDKDTLLTIGRLNTSFINNLSTLYYRKLNLKDLEISGVQLKDVKGTVSHTSKLAAIFKNEGPPGKSGGEEKERKPFYLDLEEIKLSDILYQKIDSIRGEEQRIYLNQAELKIDSIDLQSKSFHMRSIVTNGAEFGLRFFPKSSFKGGTEELVRINDSESETEEIAIPETIDFSIDKFTIKNGRFTLDDTMRPLQDENGFDPGHILFENLNFEISDLAVNSLAEVEAVIKEGSLSSANDQFVVKSFECNTFRIGTRRMIFEDLLIKTDQSVIKDKVIFKYRDISDFNDFNNRVIMEADLNNAIVGISDLLYFAPVLQKNEYFLKNRSENIDIDGLVTGRVNSLNASNIKLSLADQIIINGRMNSRNLEDVDNALLNLDLSELIVSLPTLREIIPGFNAPANFYKLGQITFKGRFDGYFQDFVAYGDLSSDLGFADLDMRLDLKEGAENAQYSGRAGLRDFDLASWSGNSDFGLLDAEAEVKNGKGLRLESVNAELSASVNTLEYRGYSYQDFLMDGNFEKNLFDGNFVITDPNIDLDFSGTIDFTDSIPIYDFVADVHALKLKELNLIKDDFGIEGNLIIKAIGTDVNNAEGIAEGSSFVFYKDDKKFSLDTFNLKANGAFPSRRTFVLNSSLVDVELNGVFKIEELPDAFIAVLKTNYPSYTRGLQAFKYPDLTPGYDFNIDMSIKESEDIFEVLLGQSIFIREALVFGRISESSQRSALDFDFPYLEVNGDFYEGLKGSLFAQSGSGEVNLKIANMNVRNIDFEPIEISASSEREKLNFLLNTSEVLDSFQNINIEGMLVTQGEDFKILLSNTDFDAFGSTWKFNEKNNVLIGEKKIIIDNLNLSDGEKTLSFDDINEKGVSIDIKDINSAFFNRLIATEKVDLSGIVNGVIEIDNIFEFDGMNADLKIQEFGFNRHKFGSVNFQASSSSFSDPIAYELRTIDLDKNLNLEGALDFKEKRNYGELRISNYPLDLLEYIIPDGISNTEGMVSGTLTYKGLWDYPEVFGDLFIKGGKTKIDYLGTTYQIGKNRVKFSEGYIDFELCELVDSKGNIAVASGGLLHSSFRNFAADLELKSPNFIGLNTTKSDNPSYYGFAQGAMDISFDGPLESIEITVVATTGRNTILNIPVEYTTENKSSSFIEIVDRSETKDSITIRPVDLTGLSLDMKVDVTENAEVVIIFDESANDILDSKGRGNIQLFIDPEGNFEMLGKYEVVSGDYLFTIPSLLVNKSFAIRNGGFIEWTGDPLDANLDLSAEYKNIQTSLDDFLREYIDGNERLINQSKLRTNVALAMDLGGTISSPDIDFDISFPNLTGELKPLADGKLSALESNPDLYNEQVFSLMIFRTLLNTATSSLATSFSGAGGLRTFYSTMSEFVSSQFSILLTSLFDEAIAGSSYFSGIDINFGASKSTALGLGNESTLLPDEYDINLTSSFNENKWNIQVGGKYVVRSALSDVQYFNPDFIFEYYISEDRRLKLNVYAKYDIQDEATQTRRLRSGVGLSYRKEFNSFSEFFNEIGIKSNKELN